MIRLLVTLLIVLKIGNSKILVTIWKSEKVISVEGKTKTLNKYNNLKESWLENKIGFKIFILGWQGHLAPEIRFLSKWSNTKEKYVEKVACLLATEKPEKNSNP